MERTVHESAHAKSLAAEIISLDPASLCCRGSAISLVEILGVITCRELKHGKFIKFSIDDGTGCAVCVLWLNQLSSPYFSCRDPNQSRVLADVARLYALEVELGAVVRVRGRLTGYRGHVQVTVSDIVSEKNNPNVEILHWVECLAQARRLQG